MAEAIVELQDGPRRAVICLGNPGCGNRGDRRGLIDQADVGVPLVTRILLW